MNLGKIVVDKILNEAEQTVTNVVGIYPGRFQPMGKHHVKTFQSIQKLFGNNNAFISTSDKVQLPKSPLSFKEKETIIKKHGIRNILNVRSPYNVESYFKLLPSKFKEYNTAIVFAVGVKDGSRLSPKYFTKVSEADVKSGNIKPFMSEDGSKNMYWMEAKHVSLKIPKYGEMSGTTIRHALGSDAPRAIKEDIFTDIMGWWDNKIYNMIVPKFEQLKEGIITREQVLNFVSNVFPKLMESVSEKNIHRLTEVTSGVQGGLDVDDGPGSFFPNLNVFHRVAYDRAAHIGYEVMKQIDNDKYVDIDPYPVYPHGPVPATSFYPSGQIGHKTAMNQVDVYSTDAYKMWQKHVMRKSALVGYSVVSNEFTLHDDDEAMDDASHLKSLLANLSEDYKKLNESTYSYNCLMVKTPLKEWDKITSVIKEEDVYQTEDGNHGIEDDPHITVLYGLHSEIGVDKIKEMVHDVSEIEFKLTGLTLFENKEFDVLKFDIDSDSLSELNERMTSLPHTTDYPEYHPHMTVAYLKSGMGKKYVKEFKNPVVCKTNEFYYSTTEGEKHVWVNELNERMSKADLDRVEKHADKVMAPVDVEFTRHFFDRLNDPRNGKDITDDELIRFFDKLAKDKDKLKDFLKKFNEFLVKDKKTSINIPFVNRAKQIVAKTIMRKHNFKSSTKSIALRGEGIISEYARLPWKRTGKFYKVSQKPKGNSIRVGDDKRILKIATEVYEGDYHSIYSPSGYSIYFEDVYYALFVIEETLYEYAKGCKYRFTREDGVTVLDIWGIPRDRKLVNKLKNILRPGIIGIPSERILYNNEINFFNISRFGFDQDGMRFYNEGNDKVSGGLADGKTVEDVAKHHNVSVEKIKSQMKKGMKVEMEHTDDKQVAHEIALDHIWELPDYYDRLEKVEEVVQLDEATKKELLDLSTRKKKESFNVKLTGTNYSKNTLNFEVGKYTSKVELSDLTSLKNEDGSKRDKIKLALSGDVKVDCTCNDFKYRFRYVASEYDASIKSESRPTRITNPNFDGVICKHLDYLLSNVDKYTNDISETTVGTGQSGTRMGYPSKDDLKKRMNKVAKYRNMTDSDKEYQYDEIDEETFGNDKKIDYLYNSITEQFFNKLETTQILEEAKLRLKLPKDILQIHKMFKKNGKQLFVVGGAVRDAILGKAPKDFDLATDAKPVEVLKMARKEGLPTLEVGKKFGVVLVNDHEIATFRKDIGKGRRPDSVDFTDIQGDVKRRDLTINALFYDIDRNEIVDLVGGIKDLQDKKVRTVGEPQLRFEEDPLRKLRALRFNSALGGTMSDETYNALKSDPSLKGVSPERIRDEFVKGLTKAKSTKQYFELALELDMLKCILPNLSVSKPFINTGDYIVLLSYVLRENDKETLSKRLNKLTYTTEEVRAITFLNVMKDFTAEKVVPLKKLQKITNLTDSQIMEFGKLVGKDFRKFIKFELSVSGQDVMDQGFKGAEIGKEIERRESEIFSSI